MMFPLVWAGIVAVIYLLHFTLPMYHGKGVQQLLCVVFALPPFGLAWGAGFLSWCIWRRPTELIRKVCYTAMITAVSIPLICVFGFLWLLMHMAP